MKSILPVGEKVILKRVKQDDVTKGGIIIPEVAKGRHTLSWIGEVIAVGPGKALDNGQRVTPDVRVGDKVVVPKHIETALEVEGDEIAVVLESQLLGVLED
jgi:chaperonin GroES